MVMFAPRNILQQGVQEDKPIYTDYIKVFEKEVSIKFMETATINVKLNEAIFYDDAKASVLRPTSEFKFLSYNDYSSVNRIKLAGKEGEIMFMARFELSNTKDVYFRQNKSIWEMMAMIGGFAISTIFAGKVVYAIAKSNSSYILTQAFMMSQYQTRTRNMLVGKDKRKAMAAKALEKEKGK